MSSKKRLGGRAIAIARGAIIGTQSSGRIIRHESPSFMPPVRARQDPVPEQVAPVAPVREVSSPEDAEARRRFYAI